MPVLEAAPAAARLGAALRGLRVSRHLSQADVARLAGVSPSAISQAERGPARLSLERCSTSRQAQHLARRAPAGRGPAPGSARAPGRPAPGRERPACAAARRPPDGPACVPGPALARRFPPKPAFSHKGVELVTVASGLVQVLLASGSPVLRQGEALYRRAQRRPPGGATSATAKRWCSGCCRTTRQACPGPGVGWGPRPGPQAQLQGYGEFETGCSSPVAKRSKRNGVRSGAGSPRSTRATSRPTPIIL